MAIGARFSEANTRFGVPQQNITLEEARDFMWPGSFRFNPQQPEQNPSNSNTIDLNLKL